MTDIRIYQINLDRDHDGVAFEPYASLSRWQDSPDVNASLYETVFKGEIEVKDIEDIYRIFNKEILASIRKAVDASMQLRSKKELIEAFISHVNVDTQVSTDWRRFVLEQEENDLTEIITTEKLKNEETRKFVANAFRDGALKTTGTEIDKLMPPVSRFGGGSRAKKKQGIIEKLKAFFEKYFGLGIAEIKAEEQEQPAVYETEPSGS